MSNQQLTLNVQIRDGYRFDSYYVSDAVNGDGNSENYEVIGALNLFTQSNEAQQNILWGESKSGKSHLLQACCAEVANHKYPVSYIPLKELKPYGTEILSGISSHSHFIAIDDVDEILGDKEWETALFNLINSTRERGQRLIMSTQENPRHVKCVLPDLASRLIWGGSYQVHALSDEDKIKALQARAKQRGFELSDRVLEYLFRRYPRDIESLMDILNKLDEQSLIQKTVITVPFLKQVLES